MINHSFSFQQRQLNAHLLSQYTFGVIKAVSIPIDIQFGLHGYSNRGICVSVLSGSATTVVVDVRQGL